jgi:hypothetical protein
MMERTHEQRLAWAVERALAEYLGTDGFPSEQWPELAQAFAGAVQALWPESDESAEEMAKYANAQSRLSAAFAQVVAL